MNGKRNWVYLITFSYRESPDLPEGVRERVYGKNVTFDFPLATLDEIKKAKKILAEMVSGSEIEIESFSCLPYEGIKLGIGRAETCTYCHHGYKAPQYQCPNCRRYFI
ncbi:hypothetical protein ACFL3M_03415 [Patescibacteria group bacterium]